MEKIRLDLQTHPFGLAIDSQQADLFVELGGKKILFGFFNSIDSIIGIYEAIIEKLPEEIQLKIREIFSKVKIRI